MKAAMPRVRSTVTLTAFLAVLALPAVCAAQAVVTDDAQVGVGKALDANFGGNPNLNVGSGMTVYVRFQPSSILPAGRRQYIA